MARTRSDTNQHLSAYPGLGQYRDGRFYFLNPYTNRQRSLKTRDLKQAIRRWALAKALCEKEYGDQVTTALADAIRSSNVPVSSGANIQMQDFLKQWRETMLEPGRVMIKIKRSQGKPLDVRTIADYRGYCLQLESSSNAGFPVSAQRRLSLVRTLLAPWINRPSHYNHMKAMLGRVYDHALQIGLVETNPMKDVEKLPVAKREVLVPDTAYVAITDQLMVHNQNKQVFDGEWRVRICDLMYMFSQQPVDLFSMTLDQIHLDEGDYGVLYLSRQKTKVDGIIDMNLELRQCIDWLLEFRRAELSKRAVTSIKKVASLLIYPSYLDRRSRWKPVQHRTFSEWWRQACIDAGFPGQYRLSDLRKKGLTDEFTNQGENDKGLHETDAMKRHYRLITPPKRSRNSLVPIRGKA